MKLINVTILSNCVLIKYCINITSILTWLSTIHFNNLSLAVHILAYKSFILNNLSCLNKNSFRKASINCNVITINCAIFWIVFNFLFYFFICIFNLVFHYLQGSHLVHVCNYYYMTQGRSWLGLEGCCLYRREGDTAAIRTVKSHSPKLEYYTRVQIRSYYFKTAPGSMSWKAQNCLFNGGWLKVRQ